jgi:3-carboxy-cis,cis-muconate cycloisomerase
MLRNLDRGGGLQMSEALLMALAESLGRDEAHALVGELAKEARCQDVSFKEIVKEHPVVNHHLSKKEIGRCLDPRNYVGLSTMFVDRVLAAHNRTKKSRGAT